jgi:hypothetical protein
VGASWVHEIESLIFLLTAAALLAQLARLLEVPYSILPVLGALGGLGLGFVCGLPNTEIPPLDDLRRICATPCELGCVLLLSA